MTIRFRLHSFAGFYCPGSLSPNIRYYVVGFLSVVLIGKGATV